MRTCTLALVMLAAAAPVAAQQNPLATARELYATARYDEALAVLNDMRPPEGGVSDVKSIEQYRSLCLLALGRGTEAEAAIAAVVTAEANAHFTTVRLVSTFAFLAPYALAMALFAASAGDPEANRQRARSVFRVSLSLSLVLYAVLFFGAPLILGVFGDDYATGSDTYLRIIGLACPLLVFKDQYIARMRSARQLTGAMPYVFVSTALEIAGTLLGALVADLTGALVGWLVALGLGALWVMTGGRRSHPAPPLPAAGAPSTSVGAAR